MNSQGTIRQRTRRILIVDDLDSVEYSIEGMLNRHPAAPPFETSQVTSPDDIVAAVARLAHRGARYDLALVDLDFGAHRASGAVSHGLTALRLLAEHTSRTTVALYTADVEHNRELMLRAAFELSPHPPATWISKAAGRVAQAEFLCALLAGDPVPDEHLRPYLNRPEPLRLKTVCGNRTQLRMWQAMALGLDSRDQIADYAHISKSTLDKFVARARGFIIDCMPPALTDVSAVIGKAANLQLASRFAFANRAYFCEPELERILDH